MEDPESQQERERLAKYGCPTADGRDAAPVGVLLSDEIKRCVTLFRMIEPFVEANLKPAGYELTVGDEFILGGERKALGKDGEIRIPPFNVVVIKTGETINLPRYLIARWNVRVKWAYEGLLWVGAAQVDPGWVGHLFCPIYNLSNKEVILRASDPIALMDFVSTTPFKPNASKAYARPPKRVLLREYNAADLRSALFELADVKLAAFDRKIEATNVDVHRRIGGFQERIDSFISITFAVVGVVVAAVALSFGKPDQPRWWDPSIFWISALAIIVAIFAWVNSKSSVQWFKSTWQRVGFELFIFVCIIIAIVRFSSRTQSTVDTLTKQVQTLQQQITSPPPTTTQSPQTPTPARPAQQAQPVAK
jgi:deoxycytidine triphosphate deaminase